jgi:alkanesulfonate monooxygenase SsuD/methylene tetrahydromethanopterin reductase-like flavin-dependent oxidoreductase (luciferase family)
MGERPTLGLMRFGCVLLQNRPFTDLRDDCLLLESIGVRTVWLADHVMTFPKMGTLLEPWTLLGALAASTERVRLGTLVTNITYRNPALLAKQAITIDHLSDGRLEVGIGAAGTMRDDARVAGVAEWTLPERAARFEEFVELIDTALRGETGTYEGEYYRTDAFERGPWPVQLPRPPLTIAAQGPRTLRVAARFADTWNALAGFGRSGEELLTFLKSCNAQLDEFAEEAGRPSSDIRRSLLVQDSGFSWWESPGALADFLGAISETGVQDLDFYYPPYGEAAGQVTPERFLELISSI